jgi:hypothetical protein
MPRLTPLLLLSLPSLTLAQTPQYRVELITPVPAAGNVLHSPVAVNDNNEATGYMPQYSANWIYHAFLYRPGQGSIDLGIPAGNPVVYAADINNSGLIVGRAGPDLSGAETNSRVWSWQNGQFTVYPQLVPGRPATAGLSNNAGRVIGYANDGSFIGKKAAEFLPGPPPSINLLMPESPGYDTALDVNNENVIMGTEIRGAYLWFPGASDRTILPPPAANMGATIIQMNDLADIAGSARVTGHPEGSTAAVYFHPDGWQLLPPGGRRNTATSINNNRWVVGNSQDNTGAIGDHGWFWSQESGRILLQDMIVDPPNTYAVWIARDINEQGTIAATIAHKVTGESFGALLIPINQPAACYANCDSSTATPVLNVADFTCFLQRFASGDAYANCDNSTAAPTLNVADFTCFLQSFAAGCP